jgi:hypothetical protein
MSTVANMIELNDVPLLLDQLQRERFYGRVSFDVREGKVTLIRTERTQVVNSKTTSRSEPRCLPNQVRSID